MKNRLIVALDVDSFKQACAIVDTLGDVVEIYKIGLAPFLGYGQKIIDYLKSNNKKFFLDLKFHDIPNTVNLAVFQACQMGAFMVTVHTIGGIKMMQQAQKVVEEFWEKDPTKQNHHPILLGVTILTSMNQDNLSSDMFISKNLSQAVLDLVQNAYLAGLRGFVASAQEAKILKERFKDVIVVTPGIRLSSTDDDQQRVATPKFAISSGADYIVVGRPIIKAQNPKQSAIEFIKDTGEAC